MKISVSPKFKRNYKKLSASVREKAQKQEKIFCKDPKDTRLKTHKLKGHLKNYWSFSIDHSNRIIFEFVSKNAVIFHDIGDHDVYK